MKKTIDVTSWYEVIDYIASNSENKKEKTKDLVFDVRQKMINEIELLSNIEKLNGVDEHNGVWNDELNEEYKKFFF